jgi:phage-related protein
MSNTANREIIIYGDAFYDFYGKQNQKVREKIDWTIGVIRDMERVPEKYLKHMEGTKDLYEIRVNHGNNIYRIFCFFDKGKLVILINGFQKKTQKTPKQEIERALELQKKYYEQKK